MSSEGKKSIDTRTIALGAAAVGAVALALVAARAVRKNWGSTPKHAKITHAAKGSNSAAMQALESNHALFDAITSLRNQFVLSLDTLQAIKKEFLSEMANGLAREGQPLKMIPTFVTRLPVGDETVTIYALDIGGSNLRVIRDRLAGNGKIVQEKVVKKSIPDIVQKSTAEELFDFVADAIAEATAGDSNKEKNLGFTFSFPVNQTALASGSLIRWTKGFSAAGVEGKDVCALLTEAMHRKGIELNIAALANDTTGTMMAGAYQHPGSDCSIGLILGTGSNACYIENIDNIKKWKGEKPASGKMAINIEWGNFDSAKRAVLPLTEFDTVLDKHSPNMGEQLYEKLMSGMYLGEITRLILKKLQEKKLLFANAKSRSLDAILAFETAYMSQILNDSTVGLTETESLLKNLDITNSTLAERQAVKEICRLVGNRAANLAGTGIAAVVTQMHKQDSGCTVAVDGSVYEHFPGFAQEMQATMSKLLNGNSNVRMVLTKDGSGNGAAVIAAVH